MSDMETPDVPTDVAPAAEPTAPEQPEAVAPENVVEQVADANGPTVEELQAELAKVQAEVAAIEAAEEQAKPAVPVIAQQPSSASPTQQPEVAPVVDEAPLPLEDAVRALIIFVKAHRTVGDSDLDAALADVEAALPAQDAQA